MMNKDTTAVAYGVFQATIYAALANKCGLWNLAGVAPSADLIHIRLPLGGFLSCPNLEILSKRRTRQKIPN
jgi:hypothetical protein